MPNSDKITKILIGNKSVPRGATPITSGLRLSDDGQQLILNTKYIPANQASQDSHEDQPPGLDDDDIKRSSQYVDLVARLGDRGDTLSLKHDAHYMSLRVGDRVLRFESGAIGEISVDGTENVYLHYSPGNSM